MSGRSMEGGYRFENFVVGASNRLAHSAAQRVADAPGAAYNPLFIYGASGLGKTHLAAAVAYHARQAHPALRVQLASAEEIVERLNRAVASGQRDQYTAHFQQVDLLLLDDVQFLIGQRETQSELLRLFNLMQGAGRQLVLTSDRAPVEIPDVDQRLLSRLSGGLVVDVGAPDYEMRLAILRNSAAERALDLADGVLDEVSRMALGNVRELKGALNRLAAFQQLDGGLIQPGDVRAVLGERPRTDPRATPAIPLAIPSSDSTAHGEPPEYAGFLADVTQEVATRVERWRVALGEACAFWRAEGYATDVLQRAMDLPVAPDVNGLLTTFSAAIEHLRSIEVQAITLDPGVRGNPAFRNPARLDEAQLLLDRALASALPLPSPNPACTRNTLEVGLSNQLALKAADAVVEHPGQRYNPLFIHGPSGTGKTHLAHAIALALQSAHPRTAVACLSASTFVEELIGSMQEGGVERWRARYRAAELLVIDDVHQLADKERTQEELFHLFNVLHERGAQIILTSDRAPRELRGVADRLRSRFEGGLVVALQPPDRALRERLVRRWLVEAGHRDEMSLVSYLADREVASGRELVGVIKRLAAAADLMAVPLDLPLARQELDGVHAMRADRGQADAAARENGDSAFLQDTEKVIWDWPDVGDRILEGIS